MSEQFSLGRHGKYGDIDFSKLKSGITKQDLGIQENTVLANIFDAINTNQDGESKNKLDRNELETFISTIKELAGNQRLSAREAKKFEINGEKLGKNKKELIEFLNKLSDLTNGIASVQKNDNEQKSELITFDDGHTEEIFPDGSKIITTFNGGKTTIQKVDKDGKTTEEIVKEGDTETKTVFNTDGTKVETKTSPAGTETTEFDNEGNPKSKTTTNSETNVVEEFVYNEQGQPVLKKKLDPQNNQTITYDGTKVTTISNRDGIETTEVKDGEKTIRHKETRTNSNNQEETIDINYNGNNYTVDFFVDKKQQYQEKVVDGKKYHVDYDENGYTKGIIVQYGESPSAIAKKFGCTLEELAEANKDKIKGKGKNRYFKAGDEIVIPKKLEADATVLQGRKSRAEVLKQVWIIEETRRIEEERKRQLAEAEEEFKAYYKKLGVLNFDDRGKKVRPEGWSQDATIIGRLSYARYLVEIDGKLEVMSHDYKILRKDYIEAHEAFVNKPQSARRNTVSGMQDVTYVKDSQGKIWYFDEKTGKAFVKDNYKKIVKNEADYITSQLTSAAEGMGTDEELLEKGVRNIYSNAILKEVNAQLKTKDSDFEGDAQTMPVEALILDEMSHTAARPLFKALINSGAMDTHEQAHSVKREIEYEVHGGIFGYTSTSDLNEIMQLCNNRDVRIELESQFKNDYTDLSENDGSIVRAYIADDGWNPQEVDQFDANWVKTGAYQEGRYVPRLDENGNYVIENGQLVYDYDSGDQEHRNAVIGRLVFDYKDKEALNKGLDVLNDNPESFDYQYLNERATTEVNTDPEGKYKSRFTEQDNVQRYLAGFHTDETGNVDVGNLSASNTCLFKSGKPARIQAEEALYGAKNGDFSQTFDSMDAETYTEISQIISNGDITGISNITELYKKALESATELNDKTKIKANAMISGQIEFTNEEIVNFCIELMHSIDDNRGRGGSSNTSAGYTNTADYQTEQLKFILQNNPQIMNEVKQRVEADNFSYTTSKANYNPKSLTTYVELTTNTKDTYLQLLADTKHIVQEEIFYDDKGNQITDAEQIEYIKNRNLSSLEEMRKYVAELEREFKKGVDAEGNLSDGANSLSEYSGFGTDREDVVNEYRNARLLLQQFEAAAKGRLRDSSGKVISLKDLTQQVVDKQEALVAANSDYKTTIAYGKMGMVLAPVIAVTIVATGGAGALGWGTFGTAIVGGVAAGTTTYSIGAYEYNTSYTGNTAEAREENLENSAIATVATAVGIGQMKYIDKIKSLTGQIVTATGADVAVDATTEYLVSGDVTATGMATALTLSAVGNVIGARAAKNDVDTSGARGDLKADVGTPNARPSVDDVVADYNAPGPRAEVRARRSEIQANEHFVQIGKKKIDIAEATPDELKKARTQVAQWADGTRNKQEMLDLIDQRLNNLKVQEVNARVEIERPVEVDTRAFDDKFNNSGFKTTSSDQPGITVDRLGNKKFEEYQAELQDLCSLATSADQLDMLAKRAESFRSEPQRERFLEIINNRRAELKENPTPTSEVVVESHLEYRREVVPGEPGRSSEIVAALNQADAERAARILSAKQGAISPEEFSVLESHLINNLKTTEQVEEFIQQIRNRVGVNDKGNMHVYQVNGKDHAALLVHKANLQINQIKARMTDFDRIKGFLSDAINTKKGLNEQEVSSIKNYIDKAESIEELEYLLEQLNQVKKSDEIRALKKHIEEQIELRKTPANVDVNEPIVRADNNSGNSRNITDDQFIDLPDGRKIYAEIVPNNPNTVTIITKDSNGTYTAEWKNVSELSELGLEVGLDGKIKPLGQDSNAGVHSAADGDNVNAGARTEDPKVEQSGANNSSAENVESSSRASRREKIKAEANRIQEVYGKKIARAYRAVLEGIDSMKTIADFDKISTRIKKKFADYAELKNDLMTRLKAKAQELKLKISEAPSAIKGVFNISKEKVDALLDMLPTQQLKTATLHVIDRIKNLKNLADYTSLKTKIATGFKRFPEVTKQLLTWLDDKFKTIGHIFKNDLYTMNEYKLNELETQYNIFANNKSGLDNALKDIIPDKEAREIAVDMAMRGEIYAAPMNSKEIAIWKNDYDDSFSVVQRDIQAAVNAKVGGGSLMIGPIDGKYSITARSQELLSDYLKEFIPNDAIRKTFANDAMVKGLASTDINGERIIISRDSDGNDFSFTLSKMDIPSGNNQVGSPGFSEAEFSELYKKAFPNIKVPTDVNCDAMVYLNELDPQVGKNFDAHGIAKISTTDQLKQLNDLLTNGIDRTKNFSTAPLVNEMEFGAVMGAPGGHAYRDGSFIIVAGKGKSLINDGIETVIVNDAYYAIIDDLQAKFPQVKFVRADEATTYFTQLNN